MVACIRIYGVRNLLSAGQRTGTAWITRDICPYFLDCQAGNGREGMTYLGITGEVSTTRGVRAYTTVQHSST